MEIPNTKNINQVKSILKNADRVLILTGAGISAESGVPTFRGGGGAPVWRGMPFEELSSAEMVKQDLPLVWEWFDYRRGKVSECEPNAAHKTLAEVQQSDQFEEFIIVTQNIDGLHALAGANDVIELHGSLWRARCLNCKARKDLREIPAETRPPICDECSSQMRPDVILFGEAMPVDAFAQAKFFAEVCDVCIVVGTSALVYPAAELPLIAKQMGAKVIEINPEETSLTAQADLSIRGKAAEIVPLIFDFGSASEQSVKQIIVDIGFEGGGFELYGRKINDVWEFWKEGSYMDFDENDDEIWREHKSEVVQGWDEAMKLLGDDWTVGYPIKIHPEFKDLIWQEFEAQRERWQLKLKWANEGRRDWAEICEKLNKSQDKEGELIIAVEEKRFSTNAEINEPKTSGNERESLEIKVNDQNKHLLIYWQERNVRDHEASGYPLDVVSSRQLKRAKAGDTLWLVTINQVGELILAGRLKAGEIVDYQTAIRKLNDTSLWDGGFFALSKENEAEFLHRINLGARALDIRFANPESDRFVLKNGKINPQQLQTMRELTAESDQILNQIWEDDGFDLGDKDFDDKDFGDEETGDDDYSFPDAVDVEIFEDIAQREPLNAEAHYNVGVGRSQTGDLEGANNAYRRAVELDPNYFAAWYNLGADHLDAGEWREAVECFDKAIAAKADFAVAYFMKGAAYDRLNDQQEAIRWTKKGLEFAPDDAQAYFNIGHSYQRLGELEKAVEWLEKSEGLDPDNARTLYELSKCYRELGEKQKEFDAYLKSFELTGSFDSMFALGTVYAHLTETDEGRAMPYYETGGELDLQNPKFFLFYSSLANLAFGNIEEARESQTDLRGIDASLADQLQFFIDRFEIDVENAEEEQEEIIHNSGTTTNQKRKPIRIRMNESQIETQSIPELYRIVLTYLVDNNLLDGVSLPVVGGKSRYFIAREPVHISGKQFFSPVEYAGFYIEAHNNRPTALKQLKNFVESLQVEFEIIIDETPAPITPSAVREENTQTIMPSAVREEITLPTDERRFLGSLLGLAVGDALGTTVEFKPTGTFPKVTTITGGGPFELNAGEWTDDTSLALCLAESLIDSDGFDAVDQMRRYCRWKNEGYLSSNGAAFDIGNTVRTALQKFEQQTGGDELNAYCGSVSPAAAGNGSLMRLAPVPLYYSNDPAKAVRFAGKSSRTTHGARECVDACRYFAALIVGAIQGRSKEELLTPGYAPVPGIWEEAPLSAKVAEIAGGSFKATDSPQISGATQGYVIPSLHAALWAFYHTDNFADGALKIVNLGYDADTYGAIYGQLAGAYYGAESIPDEWLNTIAKRDLIETLARKLYEASINE